MKILNKIIAYIKGSYQEMRKVVWPTKREITKHTLLVIGISLCVAAFIGAFDYLFTRIFEEIIK